MSDPRLEQARQEEEARSLLCKAFSILSALHGEGYGWECLKREVEALKPAEGAVGRHKKKVPVAMRIRVLRRDGFACRNCGSEESLSCDHIVPESKGGETTDENLQTLCRRCNSRKGANAA